MTVPPVRFQRNLRDVLAAAQLYQAGTTKHRIYQIVALVIIAVASYQGYTLGFGTNQLLLISIGVLLAIDPVPLILMTVTALSQPDPSTTLVLDNEGINVQSGTASRTSNSQLLLRIANTTCWSMGTGHISLFLVAHSKVLITIRNS